MDIQDWPVPDAVCDGGDLDCGSGLLLIIRRAMDPLGTGEVLQVRSREPSVEADLPAWSQMVGHEFLGLQRQDQGYTAYYVKKGLLRPSLPTTLAEDYAAAASYVWRVRVAYRGNQVSTVYGRNLSWAVGQTASFAPEVDAPSAVDYLITALGGSLVSGFAQIAARRQVIVDDMEFTGSATLSRILTYLEISKEGEPDVGGLQGTLYVSSPASRAELILVWESTKRLSPIVRTLSRSVPVTLRFMQV